MSLIQKRLVKDDERGPSGSTGSDVKGLGHMRGLGVQVLDILGFVSRSVYEL